MFVPSFSLAHIICLMLVNGLSALSLPNYQCVASEGKVISEFMKASYVLDSITVGNNSTQFLGTVRINAMEYFDFYFPVSPKYEFRSSYDNYTSWKSNSLAYDLLKSVELPSLHLCLRECNENPSCKSLIYNQNQKECHILRDNGFISQEVYYEKSQIWSFDRELDLVEPKELYFASKKCLSRSQAVDECEEPNWILDKWLNDMFSVYPNHYSIKKTIETLNHICLDKGVQLCMENQTSSFNCNLIIGTDGNNCPLLRESTIFTSKCNGSKIETRVLKQFPEIGDGVKFENDKLTLPACSSLVRQDCIYIESPYWYWILPMVIVLLVLVGALALLLCGWYRSEGETNFRGNNLSDSILCRLAQRYLPSEPQIRDGINYFLPVVLQVDSLRTENDNVTLERDDPPSYNEVCYKEGLNHAEEEPPPDYHSSVPNENNQRNPFLYIIS